MPKEHKQRGKRGDKKRKYEEDADPTPTKRSKTQDGAEDVEIIVDENDPRLQEDHAVPAGPGEVPFYGMLDDEEQEYFKRADTMLELNQFANPEERELFLTNVYKEANGKELKIANSQSCSRLMERLIVSSTPSQLKALFQKFSGHFLHLVQHRFASHCCETLFLHAAPVVTGELVAPVGALQEGDHSEPYISMEDIFLHTLDELEENLGYLMTDQFASHTLRVLLVVLSGKCITDANTKAIIKSKKSEDIGSTSKPYEKRPANCETRTVPRTFHAALDSMISSLVAGLGTRSLRALATHPTGNPVLQLLLEIAVSKSGRTKARDPTSLFRKLLPDDPPEEGTDSAAFINGLLYDPIGSRLLEAIIQFAPGHAFKALYNNLFRERLGTLARNDVACFPVIKILERLSKERLELAIEQLCPKISTLIARSRTSVIKAVIEQCRIRGVDPQPITKALQEAYGNDPSEALSKILGLNTYNHDDIAQERRKQIEDQDVGKVHGSLLAQSMLEMPGPMRQMIMDGLIAMDALTLERLAKDRSATRVLQASLTCSDQRPTSSYRRTIVQRLAPRCVDLALDSIASHVVDAMYDASKDLRYPRERVALELAKGESSLRQIPSGKAVWRNWKMDLYKRRRNAWIHEDEAEEPAKTTDFTQKGVNLEVARAKIEQRPKTAIELAREKYFRKC